jgi:hypothetical protein
MPSPTAQQRHNLGDVRWNHRRFISTDRVLREGGVADGVGAIGAPVLQYLDSEAAGNSRRKATNEGKARRKANRKRKLAGTTDDGEYGHSVAFHAMDKPVPPPASIDSSLYKGELDAFVGLEDDFIFSTFDTELTGMQAGETIFESKIFDVGFEHTAVHGSVFTHIDSFGSMAHTPKPLTNWVRQNIAEPAGVTAAQILSAPSLSDALQTVLFAPLEAAQHQRNDDTLPVVLVGHNVFGTDWPALYWSMLEEGLDPYDQLVNHLNIYAVLDTQRLAKGLPASVVKLLAKTDAGNPSYSNSSLYKALCPKAPALAWHTAKADAQATAAILASAPMRKLLFTSPPCDALKSALISIDQLVLKVHSQFNSRFDQAAPAKKARAPSTCSYCKGAVGPLGHRISTCPKKKADEEAP